MKTHRNARLTFARRLELAQCVLDGTQTLHAAATKHGVSAPTARKWIERYRMHGISGLHDRSSRPLRSPKMVDVVRVEAILQLRRDGSTMSAIARATKCSVSTVSRVCGPAGLSRLARVYATPALLAPGTVATPHTSFDNSATRPREPAEDRAERDSSQMFTGDTDPNSRSRA